MILSSLCELHMLAVCKKLQRKNAGKNDLMIFNVNGVLSVVKNASKTDSGQTKQSNGLFDFMLSFNYWDPYQIRI